MTLIHKKIPKEISQEIIKKIFINILTAVGIMLYFIILNMAYSAIKQERLVNDIEVFSGIFLIIGIVILEIAYKKDNGNIAITGIEFLIISLHSLSIMHMITLFKYDFRLYLLVSSYIFAIYYVLKSIIIYTKERKDYLESLSDIPEIVKKDEPIKKEAKKRNNLELNQNKEEENEKIEKEENKQKTKSKEQTKKAKSKAQSTKTAKKAKSKAQSTETTKKAKSKTQSTGTNKKAKSKTQSTETTKKTKSKTQNAETTKPKTKRATKKGETKTEKKKEVTKND